MLLSVIQATEDFHLTSSSHDERTQGTGPNLSDKHILASPTSLMKLDRPGLLLYCIYKIAK